MIRFLRNIPAVILCILIFVSCHRGAKFSKNTFEVRDFNTLTNWHTSTTGKSLEKLIYLDYAGATEGFTIPSVHQTPDGYFDFEFSLKNLAGTPQRFYYNLYYQNESYKFPECERDSNRENPLSVENFYGCRNADSSGFAVTPEIPDDGKFHKIKFKMRISGNPRNEKRYYDKDINQRWKRNPRTGEYSFLLVVTVAENITKKVVPDYISDISLMNNNEFVNPYYYFLYGEGKSISNLISISSGNNLKVIAQPSLDMGVYVNPEDYNPDKLLPAVTRYCGSSDDLYKNAALKPFVSYIDRSSQFANIPVIADVLDNHYSLRDFNWNRAYFKKEEMITTKPVSSDCPCAQLEVDTLKPSVTVRNQATHYGEWKKFSTGLMTRHGFTYGKYTVKVKLTELLNKSGVWNGITNSVWLVSQKDEPWNNCRKCRKEGYISKYWHAQNNERSEFTGYSEIDFEILKTINYCPLYQFPPAYYYPLASRYNISGWDIPMPSALQPDSANVMVCCTNWDMACPDPDKYDVGCKPVNYGNKTFLAHRWDYWYKALSERSPAPDDVLFAGDYYYFQIEWNPEDIIWRMGPEKDKLKVIAYMNSSITCIPNNQMILVISQEFHDTMWWHGSPFEQGFIPFPEKDLPGTLYEITIE